MSRETAKESILFLVLFIILGVLLHPTLSSILFSYKRRQMFQNLNSQIQQTKTINGRSFWVFREFYYPGNFIFEPLGFKKAKYQKILDELNLSTKIKKDIYPFLFFKSKKILSLEGMTNKENVYQTINIDEYDQAKILINTKKSIMYKYNNEKLLFVFIKPIEEMKLTNAHYDYKGEFKDVINKYTQWVVFSIIDSY